MKKNAFLFCFAAVSVGSSLYSMQQNEQTLHCLVTGPKEAKCTFFGRRCHRVLCTHKEDFKRQLEDACTRATLLLESGTDPDIPDEGGNTALHLAVKMNWHAMAKILLQHDAQHSLQNNEGKTPLHYGFVKRSSLHSPVPLYSPEEELSLGLAPMVSTVCAERLLDFGARIDIVDNEGQSPEDLLPDFFEQYVYEPCVKAVKDGDAVKVAQFLDQGVPGSYGYPESLLFLAAQHKQKDIIPLLLLKGADILRGLEYPEPEPGEYMASLHAASVHGDLKTIKALLVSPYYKVKNGQIDELVTRHMDVLHKALNMQDYMDSHARATPQALAIQHGHQEAAALLDPATVKNYEPEIRKGYEQLLT